ncbi:hypothetical protein FMN50_14475 [Rhodobacterales bacterium]|nr:hypothetical protein FMN50_14475 [Rhodobacterales bacterium]
MIGSVLVDSLHLVGRNFLLFAGCVLLLLFLTLDKKAVLILCGLSLGALDPSIYRYFISIYYVAYLVALTLVFYLWFGRTVANRGPFKAPYWLAYLAFAMLFLLPRLLFEVEVLKKLSTMAVTSLIASGMAPFDGLFLSYPGVTLVLAAPELFAGLVFCLVLPVLARPLFVLPSLMSRQPLGLVGAFRQSRGYGLAMGVSLVLFSVFTQWGFNLLARVYFIELRRLITRSGYSMLELIGSIFVLDAFLGAVLMVLSLAVIAAAYNRSVARRSETMAAAATPATA